MLQALPQTSSVVVATSHSVCPSPLYDHLGGDLLQKIKHTLAHRPSAFSEVPPDIPALFPCIPSASDPDRQFFSLLLNRTLKFEGRHEIWSPLYPMDLHFSKLIGACRIDELDLALKHSLEGTKWPNKHVLRHKCIMKVEDFFLSGYSGFSLYFSCALPW